MNKKHILIITCIIILSCCFGKGKIFQSIRDVISKIYLSCTALIFNEYERLSRKVPNKQSLYYAILANDVDRVIYIISRKNNEYLLVDPILPVKNNELCTALMFAVKNKKEEVALGLISYWCDAQKPDANGHTPLYYARKFGMIRIVKELEKRGAPEH
ncbi:MAG: ankyrin repeat domain-containing protein [Puniceicoccales bacterium]|jgi:ankyrin repeat protein|nr:ankyrin repeat domain-containing protein [Puniceicoccales bacterium]